MTAPNPFVAEIRRLQAAEDAWRAERPGLAFRFAALDLVTACSFQRYSDHSIRDDVALLDRAIGLLGKVDPERLRTAFETASIAVVERLDAETPTRHEVWGDLDAEDDLRRTLVTVPPRVLLDRDDDEASPDTLCWNEANGLVEGVSEPYRCASRISALAYFSAPDRLGLIDEMVALRERYEWRPSERDELETAIRDRVERYLEDVSLQR